jgi:GT2 family glycosyltransferase
MAQKSPKICTVIVEYNNPPLTLSTLRSLKQAALPPGYNNLIVLVDNSPVPDPTFIKDLKRFSQLELISTMQNTGFAKGINLGIEAGLKHGCDYFLLLNNDVEVHPSFLGYLFRAAQAGADLVVPKIYFAPGYEYHHDRYKKSQRGKVIWYAGGTIDWDNVYTKHLGIDEVDHGQFKQKKPVEFANFCCILIKREVFETIGLLDEDYFLYWEDADFSYRAQKAGFKIIFEPRSLVWHKNSGSSGSGSQLHDYYLTRNRLLFGYRYASAKTKFALFRESVKKLIIGRPGEKRGILDFYLKRLGKGKFV